MGAEVVITGDPALDAWLAAHAYDIAVGWLFLAAALFLLPGLAQALKEDQ